MAERGGARPLSEGAIGCICVAFPSAIVGAFGKVTNFTAAGYPGPYDLLPADRKDVLPIAVRYVTPTIVQIVGSLTIAASVMSTVDSSTLSASTLVARNVYHSLIRPKARDAEVALVLRSTVWLVGGAAVTLALAVRSGAHLWAFATDLAYVLLFPQLVCLLFFPDRSNARGAASAFFVGLVLRVLCGDPGLGVPALVKLPLYDSELGQQFPYRTLCMVTSLGSLIVISRLTARAPRQDINTQTSPSLAILDNLESTKPRLDNLENNEPRLDNLENTKPRLDNLENTKPRLDKFENNEPRLDKLENAKPRLDNLENTKPRLDNLENTKPRLENLENTKPRLDNLQNTKPRLDNLENSEPRPGDGGLPSNSKARTVASSRMSPERQPATKARVPREEFFTAQCGAASPAVVKKSELPSPTASTPFKKTPASVARRSRNPTRANGINSVSRPSDKAAKSSTPPTATSKAPSSFVSGAPSRMEVAGDPHKHSDVLDAKGKHSDVLDAKGEHKKERPVSDSPAKVRKTEDAGSRGGKRSRQSTAASTPNDCVTGTASAASAALAASATSQPKASKQARRTEKTKAPSEKSEVGGGIGRDRS
ncbi:hypothetical protein HPB48_010644 [Haemaphysalis longicornis]|uniref:Uncharacterized protein n=1 Tax=Haemaphysalis longicornis TaxID=44386 RepID=A0A9J6FZM5_HAELO|nr:hypothetical protein HPB48_010644 [Haemaphysalis longicornis]